MTLQNNINFLKWIFKKNKNLRDEKTFNLLSYAYVEDPYAFMRTVLYFGNVRSSAEHELTYKTILHFLSIIQPDILFANVELVTQIGRKKDILYFNKSMFEKLNTWVKHKAKEDDFYRELSENGKLLDENKKPIKYHKAKSSSEKWTNLLEQILDDPRYNGIILE